MMDEGPYDAGLSPYDCLWTRSFWAKNEEE
jgi:hypothetical protein